MTERRRLEVAIALFPVRLLTGFIGALAWTVGWFEARWRGQ